MYNNFVDNGVIITPNVIYRGDDLTVKYDGLLFKDGAHELFMHTGFGDQWEEIKDIKMNKTDCGFEAIMPICEHNEYNTVNLTFRDCAHNWDNNCGANYTFEIQPKLSH